MTEITMPEANYQGFSRTKREIAPKLSNLPSVFCPVLLTANVHRRPDAPSQVDLYKKSFRDELVAKFPFEVEDCHPVDTNTLWLALRDYPQNNTTLSEYKAQFPELGVNIEVQRVLDTDDDAEGTRRSRLQDSYNIATMHARNAPIDALTIVVPIAFFIPDPEWKPRQQFVQVFPNSVWVTFFKIWGDVVHAEMVFYGDGAHGTMPHCGIAPSYPKTAGEGERMICVVVKYRESKAITHAAVALFERLLAAPSKMKIGKARAACCSFVNYDLFRASVEEGGGSVRGPQQNQQMNQFSAKGWGKGNMAPPGAPPPPPADSGKDNENFVPIEKFKEVVSKLQRLEKENEELMQLLMEMSKKEKAKDRQITTMQQNTQQRPVTGGMQMVQPMQAGYNQMGQYQQMGANYQQWGQMNTMQVAMGGNMQQSNSMAAYGKRDTVQDTDANAPWKKKQATAANVSRNETLQSSPPRIAQPTAGPVDLTAARQSPGLAMAMDLTEGDDLELLG